MPFDVVAGPLPLFSESIKYPAAHNVRAGMSSASHVPIVPAKTRLAVTQRGGGVGAGAHQQ